MRPAGGPGRRAQGSDLPAERRALEASLCQWADVTRRRRRSAIVTERQRRRITATGGAVNNWWESPRRASTLDRVLTRGRS